MGYLIGSNKNGECCDPPCQAPVDDPCECNEECCEDLPETICAWCWVHQDISNNAGCCTQEWWSATSCVKGYLDGVDGEGCQYTTIAGGLGDVIVKYDKATDFWKLELTVGCGHVGISDALGCDKLEGVGHGPRFYYSAEGDKIGGVGTPPAAQWGTCYCPDPGCDCLDPGGSYGYIHEEGCVELNDDPCCLASNRVCPQAEVEGGTLVAPAATSCSCP